MSGDADADASRRRRRAKLMDSTSGPPPSTSISDQKADHWLGQAVALSDAQHQHHPHSALLQGDGRGIRAKDLNGSATVVTPKRRIPWFCILITVVIVVCLSLILAALGFYYKSKTSVEENRENQLYLKKLVRQVNEANLHWKAKYNPFGARKKDFNFPIEKNVTAIQQSVDDLNKFFNTEKMQLHLREIQNFPTESLPIYFDAREYWPHCPSISEVPNQGGCGACYAVAASGVASDRACIHSNGTIRTLFSEEDILGCCAVCGNCYGGDPLKALVYWVNEGLVTGGRDGCRPYSADIECGVPCSPAEYPFNEYRRKCTRRCQSIYFQNSYEDDKHYATVAYSMFPRTMSLDKKGKNRLKVPTVVGHFNETSGPLSNEQIRHIIMKELYLSGPTTMAFPVTEEFLHYASGIFSPYPVENFNKRIIYWHVVRLIGWGQYDNGKHYWIAVNSFGRHWGDNGVFKVDTSLVEDFGLEYETALP